jgi:hypothetical protein
MCFERLNSEDLERSQSLHSWGDCNSRSPPLSAQTVSLVNYIFGERVSGKVVNTVSLGHITWLDCLQNGHGIPCCSSTAVPRIPPTLNVFRHLVQVTIFSMGSLAHFVG